MTQKYDLVILGSGSTAFAAALAAQSLGKTAVMTEERVPGGTCVNRGCLPSKNLIEASKIVHEAKHPRYPGLSPCEMKVDFAELIRQKDDIVHGYRQKKYESLTGGKFNIIQGHAQFVDEQTVSVDGKLLIGSKILIATGSRPVIPTEIDGLDKISYLTSDLLTADESMELQELPTSLMILGGGYIALELGQMFARFGTRVTILERSNQLLKNGYEPELGLAVAQVFESEGVEIVYGAKPKAVRKESSETVLLASVNGTEKEFRSEHLLIATGRQPNTDRIAIERSGVKLSPRQEVEVDELLQTNVPHIYAAGDVIGKETGSQMATPVGSHDGGIVGHNAFSPEAPRRTDHRVIPRAIFTDPQIATVGMTEEQAIAAGHPCWCHLVDMTLVPRAGAVRETRGFIKMVANAQTNEVLGVTMFGLSAAEVIHEAAMGLRFNAKINDFIDMLHVYPTMAEAVKIAAISRFKDPAKLSCCAE
jgi:mercuric reductase